jgi:hypothetical protein
MQFDSYRPELHYMRGPGPKWHAKHDLAFASLDGAIGGSWNDNECCAPRQHLPSPMLASSYRGMPSQSEFLRTVSDLTGLFRCRRDDPVRGNRRRSLSCVED